MRAFLLLALFLLVAPLPGRAQTAGLPAAKPAAAAAPAGPTLTPAQAQAVLNVLRNEKAREQFTAVLEDMVKGVQAAQPAKPAAASLAADSVGAELVVQGSAWAKELGEEFTSTAEAIGSVPMLWSWVQGVASDQSRRDRLLETGWKLLVVLAAAAAAEWAMNRVLRRPRAMLVRAVPSDEPIPEEEGLSAASAGHRHQGLSVAWRMLRRLPFVLGALLLELVPVAVFAVVGHLLITTPLGDSTNTRLVVLAVVDAYILVRVIMCVTRSFVSPGEPRLRLIRCDDSAARYVERWMRRLSAVAVFGFAVAEVGLLFGLYRSAHDVLIKLVGLAIHIMLIVIVLQSREAVAHRLRASRRRKGTLAALQNGFAARWHAVAIFYIVAVWLVAAAEIHDGYSRLLHFGLETTAVLLAARLLGIVLLGALDRAVRLNDETAARYPGLDSRLRNYHPLMRGVTVGLLTVAAGVALLEVWGLEPVAWFESGALGQRLLGALTTSAIAVLLALVVWEMANAAVERKVDSLTRAAQTARAARLRTLMPMLRTALLVAILVITGLVVLSQIGLNVAPLLAGAGVVGVAIGFGSQKLVQDLITGLFLLLENAMQVGDVVALGGLSGTVEYLSIRTIRLRAVDGSLHIIPFSSVTTVTNQTRDFAYALMDLPIGLNEEPDRVAELLAKVAAEMQGEDRWRDAITADLEVMGVYAFSDNAWTMRVRLRTTPSQRWAVNREFNRRVKYCFDENAVQSPITAYRVQGWLPPGSERPIPKPPETQEAAP